MKSKFKLFLQLILVLLLTNSCATKKYTINQGFYSSGTEIGLLIIKNEINTRRSGQSALGKAIVNDTKYDNQLRAVDPKLDPVKKLKRLYLNMFETKGKKITLIEQEFNPGDFEKFETSNKEKDFYGVDLRSLKSSFRVDELMLVTIEYGLNQNYSGVFEMGKGGYSHVLVNIIDLNDNSIIYKGETWGNGKLKSNWDTPPDYVFLREAIDAAINQTVELESAKY